MFIEHLLCATQYAKSQGHVNKPNKYPCFMELTDTERVFQRSKLSGRGPLDSLCGLSQTAPLLWVSPTLVPGPNLSGPSKFAGNPCFPSLVQSFVEPGCSHSPAGGVQAPPNLEQET